MSIEYLTSDAEKVNYLCALLKAKATGKESSESEFKQIRHELLSNNSLVTRLPSWLKLTRDLDSFWDFIQPKFSTYQDRRVFLDQEFSELSNQLEFGNRPQIINQPAFKQTNQNISPTTPFVAPATTDSFSSTSTVNKKNKVFIVHGRDNEAKQEAARYIESMGLEAIILHEKASSGMTIIEKIEHYAGEVDFALVIYTCCDKGKSADEQGSPSYRARQNVVFEHG